MSECLIVENLIKRKLLEELSNEEEGVLLTHFENCEECQKSQEKLFSFANDIDAYRDYLSFCSLLEEDPDYDLLEDTETPQSSFLNEKQTVSLWIKKDMFLPEPVSNIKIVSQGNPKEMVEQSGAFYPETGQLIQESNDFTLFSSPIIKLYSNYLNFLSNSNAFFDNDLGNTVANFPMIPYPYDSNLYASLYTKLSQQVVFTQKVEHIIPFSSIFKVLNTSRDFNSTVENLISLLLRMIKSTCFSLLDLIDFEDLPGFMIKLKQRKTLLSQYLWNQLSSNLQKSLSSFDLDKKKDVRLEATLINQLNRILQSNTIYTEERFLGETLPPHIRKFICTESTKIGNETLAFFNRLLLEYAYPNEIKKIMDVANNLAHFEIKILLEDVDFVKNVFALFLYPKGVISKEAFGSIQYLSGSSLMFFGHFGQYGFYDGVFDQLSKKSIHEQTIVRELLADVCDGAVASRSLMSLAVLLERVRRKYLLKLDSEVFRSFKTRAGRS